MAWASWRAVGDAHEVELEIVWVIAAGPADPLLLSAFLRAIRRARFPRAGPAPRISPNAVSANAATCKDPIVDAAGEPVRRRSWSMSVSNRHRRTVLTARE